MKKLNIDKLGIGFSSLCAIHCLLTPIFLLLLPTLGEAFHHDEIHLIFFLLVAPLALLSFYKTSRAHKKHAPIALGAIGTFLLLLPLVLHEPLHNVAHVISLCGSIFLIYGHFKAIQCRRCHHHHHHHV